MIEMQLKDAKAHFSSVVTRAKAGDESIITRNGKPEAVVISYDKWQKMEKKPTFAEFLMTCPLDDEDLPPRLPEPYKEDLF